MGHGPSLADTMHWPPEPLVIPEVQTWTRRYIANEKMPGFPGLRGGPLLTIPRTGSHI